MIESNARSPANFDQRCHRLNTAAQVVRQRAIIRGTDIVGWRLSRLMRDANTDAEVNVAERKFAVWLHTISV